VQKIRLILIIITLFSSSYGIYFGINAYVKTPDAIHLYRLSLPCFVFVMIIIQLIIFVKNKDKK
jgi:hypothetical protein